MSSRIDELLARARAGISRVRPDEAARMQTDGALLIDTRPVEQRSMFGAIPGALVIERNVLEWRLDPTSTHRDPTVAGHAGAIVVLCQQGYSSSLAVAALVALGVPEVHDLDGGFEAWAAAGLPTELSAAGDG